MYGYYQDAFPRGGARHGWDPQNPTYQTMSLPVSSEIVAGHVEPTFIWPGMVITPNKAGSQWVRGVEEGVTPTVVAIAQNASEDYDVLAASSLVGLLCSDRIEIATPFFARKSADGPDPMYTQGLPVTYCKADETEERTVGDETITISLAGYIRPAKAGEPVIGTVKVAPGTIIGINGSGAVTTAPDTANSVNGSEALQIDFERTTNSHVRRENAYLVTIQTAFNPTV